MWLLVATLSLAFIIPSCGAKLIYIDIHVIQIKCLYCMYVCAHVAYFSVVQQTSQGKFDSDITVQLQCDGPHMYNYFNCGAVLDN